MGFISEYKQSQLLVNEKFDVIFFSEGRNYHIYFEPLFQELLLKSNLKICYITSDILDPVLNQKSEKFKAFYVKWMLGYVFSKLKADVMIMTMPDLNNYLYKRSAYVKKYIYLFHAAVSTHQQYKADALLNYDTIFCTGNYQKNEIQATETLYKLPSKELIDYGYPLFDLLKRESNSNTNASGVKRVLIAPTWYNQCILNTCINEIVEELSSTGYELVIRSHPEYNKRNKKSYRKLKGKMEGSNHIYFDEEPNVIDSLLKTDFLITDRSGIAFEFAFGMKKPVLFIDTPLKQTNNSMNKIQIEPLENRIRNSIGICFELSEIGKIKEGLIHLENELPKFSNQINDMEDDIFFPSVKSVQNGFNYILFCCKKSD